MTFEKFTQNFIYILVQVSEVLFAYHIYRLSNSTILGILSLFSLPFFYTLFAIKSSGLTLDKISFKDIQEKLETFSLYELCINLSLCILLSYF